jgi:hypothetical protein
MTIRCLLMIVACVSCLGCRAAHPSNPQDPAALAGDPPTAAAQVPSAGGNTVVYAYYFHQTYRCLSCQMLEETAAGVIQEHFAQPIQAGQVVWMPVNIDKPDGKTLRQQFNGQASDLVLVRMENGVCKESKKLDESSGLVDRPDAFAKYLIDEVSACLGGSGR